MNNQNKNIIKSKILNWIAIIVGSMFMSSCDCAYLYEFIVENQTKSKIYVYCKTESNNDDNISKTVSISPNTSVVIWSTEVFSGGCPGPNKEDCIGLIDSISILMNDSMTTKLNYKNLNNWTFTQQGTQNESLGTFKVSLVETDFIETK